MEVKMQKWEYLRLEIFYSGDGATITPSYDPNRALAVSKPGVIKYINKLGRENWELVSAFSDGRIEVYYLKHLIE